MFISIPLIFTSCANSKVKKDIQGSWSLIDITYDGVDFVTVTGSTIGGIWTFNKETYDWELITSAGTQSGSGSYEIADPETIDFDGGASVPMMSIETLTDSDMTLTYTNTDGVLVKHLFVR